MLMIKLEQSKIERKQAKPVVRSRAIQHPNFKNVSFAEAEQQLAQADRGEAIIRPSSSNVMNLSLTWKVWVAWRFEAGRSAYIAGFDRPCPAAFPFRY